MPAEHGNDLLQVVALLGAGVVAVPIFKRLGLGSVIGYLAAGLAIGPYGLKLFTDPHSILGIAELGVVMFLFVIGLEMQPSRLWGMRQEIFGLGAAQVGVCCGLITGTGILLGLNPALAFVGGMGFVLSSTAIVMQMLDERGDTSTPRGQRVVSVLLFEDLSIVPLLAFVAFLAPAAEGQQAGPHWVAIATGVGSLVCLIAAGRYLLSPMFRVLAAANAREVMTAAALLVVLGAALLMQVGGLSMALGAFLAGVLLSESTFRHQLEADIEPFRGILLGLFFLGVGMSLDLTVFARDWPMIVGGVLGMRMLKSLGIYLVARLTQATHAEALYRSVVLAQGGEFAFVLYGAALAAEIFDPRSSAILSAIVIVSMALTPIGVFALRWLMPTASESMENIDAADGLHGRVLLIGFGRFGQVASQLLLARGIDVAIIDTDTEMIRSASQFGFKVYYGDGGRLDVLRASGAGEATAIAVCVDKRGAANHIVELCKAEFPQAKLLARAFDREHAVELVGLGVDVQVRETFESAIAFGELALRELGVSPVEAAELAEDIRRRDAERFALNLVAGPQAGIKLMHSNIPKPEPFTTPQRPAIALSEETALITGDPTRG